MARLRWAGFWGAQRAQVVAAFGGGLCRRVVKKVQKVQRVQRVQRWKVDGDFVPEGS
jgi:hypothetical protein